MRIDCAHMTVVKIEREGCIAPTVAERSAADGRHRVYEEENVRLQIIISIITVVFPR